MSDAAPAYQPPDLPLSPAAADRAIELCRELIRIDSANPTSTERAAAEYVAERLTDAGLTPTLLESEPGRASVIARVRGADPSRPALLVHGHLDVVPAERADWSVDPFAGEIRDGLLWGRGAVDMKNMDAMVLAVVEDWARTGRQPPRDLVLAFVADEEAGGRFGARWLVREHPELFADCSEGIGEVGGFSYTVHEDLRLYPIEIAEKGMAWLTLTARGRAGHGSMITEDNAVTTLAEVVARVGRHRFPTRLTPAVREFLAAAADAFGLDFDPEDPEPLVAKLGPLARIVGATLRHTATPTMLDAGYKVNVVPQVATAAIDGRFLPGLEAEFFAELDEVLGPDVTRDFLTHEIAYETTFDGPLIAAMCQALQAEDPAAQPVPYCLSGGTDAKHFSTLGIRCFGFSPLLLPPDLDFAGLFHGVDERVPLEALRFGTRVLARFLASC